MLIRVLKRLTKESAGFTLIELLVCIAIAGVLTIGISAAIFQLEKVGSTVSDATAFFSVNNAGRWVSKDAMMAQSVTLGESNGFPITLKWTEYNGTKHTVIYYIENGELRRSSEEAESTLISQYIDAAESSCTWDESNGGITLTITAKAGEGSDEQSETRIFNVRLRAYPQ